MDNYFSNIPLFKHLRGLNIGACGTTRINSACFPDTLKVGKSEKLQWNTLTGVVIDKQVLAVVWMDNAPVTMLSTIHKINTDDDFIERIRRCPRNTSTNAANVRAIFNGNPRAALKIPKLIDDYNHNMNGVDLSNQFRAYYSTNSTWTTANGHEFTEPPNQNQPRRYMSPKNALICPPSVSPQDPTHL